jgi:hypothetical protein
MVFDRRCLATRIEACNRFGKLLPLVAVAGLADITTVLAEKRVNWRWRRKIRQRSPSHFGSKSHPSREKRSFVRVANIGATHSACDFLRRRALASAGNLFKGLRSAIQYHVRSTGGVAGP